MRVSNKITIISCETNFTETFVKNAFILISSRSSIVMKPKLNVEVIKVYLVYIFTLIKQLT